MTLRLVHFRQYILLQVSFRICVQSRYAWVKRTGHFLTWSWYTRRPAKYCKNTMLNLTNSKDRKKAFLEVCPRITGNQLSIKKQRFWAFLLNMNKVTLVRRLDTYCRSLLFTKFCCAVFNNVIWYFKHLDCLMFWVLKYCHYISAGSHIHDLLYLKRQKKVKNVGWEAEIFLSNMGLL